MRVWVCSAPARRNPTGPARLLLRFSYRDVAVYDQQFFPSHIELATQLIWFPVDNSKALVIWVKNGLEKLELGLQPRHRHLPLISGRATGGRTRDRRRPSSESQLVADNNKERKYAFSQCFLNLKTVNTPSVTRFLTFLFFSICVCCTLVSNYLHLK